MNLNSVYYKSKIFFSKSILCTLKSEVLFVVHLFMLFSAVYVLAALFYKYTGSCLQRVQLQRIPAYKTVPGEIHVIDRNAKKKKKNQ